MWIDLHYDEKTCFRIIVDSDSTIYWPVEQVCEILKPRNKFLLVGKVARSSDLSVPTTTRKDTLYLTIPQVRRLCDESRDSDRFIDWFESVVSGKRSLRPRIPLMYHYVTHEDLSGGFEADDCAKEEPDRFDLRTMALLYLLPPGSKPLPELGDLKADLPPTDDDFLEVDERRSFVTEGYKFHAVRCSEEPRLEEREDGTFLYLKKTSGMLLHVYHEGTRYPIVVHGDGTVYWKAVPVLRSLHLTTFLERAERWPDPVLLRARDLGTSGAPRAIYFTADQAMWLFRHARGRTRPFRRWFEDVSTGRRRLRPRNPIFFDSLLQNLPNESSYPVLVECCCCCCCCHRESDDSFALPDVVRRILGQPPPEPQPLVEVEPAIDDPFDFSQVPTVDPFELECRRAEDGTVEVRLPEKAVADWDGEFAYVPVRNKCL